MTTTTAPERLPTTTPPPARLRPRGPRAWPWLLPLALVLGFGAALLVNGAERRGLRGTVLTRTVVLTAWAIPGVIIGVIWALLYEESQSGILNYGLSTVGFSGQIPFLSDPNVALVS